MTLDRQADRWARARVRHHEAQQAHRDAQRELEAAAAELVTAGAALSERVRLLDARGPQGDIPLRGSPRGAPSPALRGASGLGLRDGAS